ncbi:hypothetical protein [Aquisalinus flavus]|uniref:Uncharacterized protein n=1 Tax=Aquisalinus flavus TaxID=1526572 RepID=A0A8J2Y777_9PROT|nr:hypothetical protein [Aquisalinus flavus]MBD0427098.1 hypothetical protein [Aquisalinus flavus]UNE46921.1 hypothetical protein FF099_02040 [Aquisalinus flavus]GGC98362.1 hypothetical protein GCM10011342_04120 [Aquisalinus flavus]
MMRIRLTGLFGTCLLLTGLLIAPIAAQDLSGLTPEQRRAVERLQAQGVELQQVDGAQSLRPQPEQAVPSAGRILKTPDFLKPQRAGEITGLNLDRTARDADLPYLTFGQVFTAGDMIPGDHLAIRVGDRLFPVQADVKAAHGDGSVRHAVLTADLTGLDRGRHKAMLLRVPAGPATPHSASDRSQLTVSIVGRRADRSEFAGQLDLLSLSAQRGTSWLSGPFAREQSHTKQIGPLLSVRADHRVYAGGAARTRLTFENHKTFAPGMRDMTYTVIVHDGDQVIARYDDIEHYRGSNWSTVIETTARSGWRVEQDPAYLIAAGAVMPFDLGYGVAETKIAADLAALAQDTDVLTPGLLEPYMPSTGGRADIGPLPAWDVMWLKSQSARAEQLMLAMAGRAGAIPWHYAEDATGLPVKVEGRPWFWAEDRGTEEWRGDDRIPSAYFMGSDGGWSLDTAHKPLMTYTAYLATGDAYFARELAHEAAWVIAAIWPDLRNVNAPGEPMVGEELQLRGRAWALRDVSAAAFLLPDGDPMKGYFRTARDISLTHMKRKYIDSGFLDAAGETEGWFEDTSYSIAGAVPPWQNDFMVMVLAHEALRGSADAAALVRWAENYQAGRFLATGASPSAGAAYAHMLNEPGTQSPVGSWMRAMALTSVDPAYLNNFPDDGTGYVVSAYAALAMTHAVTRSRVSLDAAEALAVTQRDSRLFDPSNAAGIYTRPQFLITYPAAGNRVNTR